jgi:Spy/CpxP family protein refolding chaperone
MKHFIPLAVVGLLLTANVIGQDSTAVKSHKRGEHHQGMGDKKHDHKGDKALAGVQLTDDQKAQAKTLHADFKKQADAIKAQNLSADEQKKQLEALHKDQKQKMEQLLTPEQKAKAAENRKKAGDKMKVTSDARLEKMKANLGLKDEQVAQLKAQQAQTKAQMKAIHDDQSLTADAKKAQVKALMQKQKESWKTILTPEQLEKLKSSHKAKGQEAK